MITGIIAELNGDVTARRISLWSTKTGVCSKADAKALGLVEGVTYKIWVAQMDGKTQSGKDVKQGEWFAVEES